MTSFFHSPIILFVSAIFVVFVQAYVRKLGEWVFDKTKPLLEKSILRFRIPFKQIFIYVMQTVVLLVYGYFLIYLVSLPNPQAIAKTVNYAEEAVLGTVFKSKYHKLPDNASAIQDQMDKLSSYPEIERYSIYTNAILSLQKEGLIQVLDVKQDGMSQTVRITPLGEKVLVQMVRDKKSN